MYICIYVYIMCCAAGGTFRLLVKNCLPLEWCTDIDVLELVELCSCWLNEYAFACEEDVQDMSFGVFGRSRAKQEEPDPLDGMT